MESATTTTPVSPLVIERADDPHRPCIENRIAYEWEHGGDLLASRHFARRDQTILRMMCEGVKTGANGNGRPAILDVGCGYGNHLFMANAKLGKDSNVRLVGVNLDPRQLSFAEAFARSVPGFQNCEFMLADLSQGLPLPDATFDVVALSDVLEHMVDPAAALRELMRVLKPDGRILVTTPLRDSLFKRLAKLANALSFGKLYKSYYRGKNTELDKRGEPVMNVHAGNPHVSEMSYRELTHLAKDVGLRIHEQKLMSVMSGSRWFDRHLIVLACVLVLEAIHDVLRFPGWAHSATLCLCRSATPTSGQQQGQQARQD